MRREFFSLIVICVSTACGGTASPLGGPHGGTEEGVQPAAAVGEDAGNSSPASSSNSSDNNGPTADAGTTGPTQTPIEDAAAGAVDAYVAPPKAVDASAPPSSTAPTWTEIFDDYLGSGTTGTCPSCHSETSTPSKAYTWLGSRGCGGASLVDPNTSCLTWFGGSMPRGGPSSYPKAVTDMEAWVAAGAQNN